MKSGFRFAVDRLTHRFPPRSPTNTGSFPSVFPPPTSGSAAPRRFLDHEPGRMSWDAQAVWSVDSRLPPPARHRGQNRLKPACYARIMSFPQSFFAARFGITEHDLESYLTEALSAGGDYADLYFEYLA